MKVGVRGRIRIAVKGGAYALAISAACWSSPGGILPPRRRRKFPATAPVRQYRLLDPEPASCRLLIPQRLRPAHLGALSGVAFPSWPIATLG
jgi:hypothetical protein